MNYGNKKKRFFRTAVWVPWDVYSRNSLLESYFQRLHNIFMNYVDTQWLFKKAIMGYWDVHLVLPEIIFCSRLVLRYLPEIP